MNKFIYLVYGDIHTDYQEKVIGQKLISFGINKLRERGCALVFTYGDPNYYSKVGFRSVSEEIAKAPLKMTRPEGWLCQPLPGNTIFPISGDSYRVETLNKAEYW